MHLDRPDLEAGYGAKAFRFFRIRFSVVNNHCTEALYEWKGFKATPCWLLQNLKERHTLQFRIKPERAIEVHRLFPRWKVQIQKESTTSKLCFANTTIASSGWPTV